MLVPGFFRALRFPNPSEPLIAKLARASFVPLHAQGHLLSDRHPLPARNGPFYFPWLPPVSATHSRSPQGRTSDEAHARKNPDTWAAIWVALSNPLWQGAIMAILISFLRVLYDAKETSLSAGSSSKR